MLCRIYNKKGDAKDHRPATGVEVESAEEDTNVNSPTQEQHIASQFPQKLEHNFTFQEYGHGDDGAPSTNWIGGVSGLHFPGQNVPCSESSGDAFLVCTLISAYLLPCQILKSFLFFLGK